MSLRWLLIVLAIGFIAASGSFMPKTKDERVIVIALICFLVILALLVGWALLPFA